MTGDSVPESLHPVVTQRDELYRALIRLERELADPSGGRRWLEDIGDALGELRQRFDVHLDITEGEDRLFAQIMERAPRLAHAIDVLRAEHDPISAAIDEAIAHASDPSLGADRLRAEIEPLLTHLVRHRQKGADLLYEAYDVDLGALD